MTLLTTETMSKSYISVLAVIMAKMICPQTNKRYITIKAHNRPDILQSPYAAAHTCDTKRGWDLFYLKTESVSNTSNISSEYTAKLHQITA